MKIIKILRLAVFYVLFFLSMPLLVIANAMAFLIPRSILRLTDEEINSHIRCFVFFGLRIKFSETQDGE